MRPTERRRARVPGALLSERSVRCGSRALVSARAFLFEGEESMLTGKLTRLRPMEMTDLDRYVEWINDPEVVRFLGDAEPLMSYGAEKAWLEAHAAQPPAWADFALAIDTADGRHIGSIALHDARVRSR